jgi:hypothetical protein
MIAARWLEHVAGCQQVVEAPSWDTEEPTRSCPPLSKKMLSLLALSAGAPTLAPKVTVLACTEAF